MIEFSTVCDLCGEFFTVTIAESKVATTRKCDPCQKAFDACDPGARVLIEALAKRLNMTGF
jgi:hypothetical protein